MKTLIAVILIGLKIVHLSTLWEVLMLPKLTANITRLEKKCCLQKKGMISTHDQCLLLL